MGKKNGCGVHARNNFERSKKVRKRKLTECVPLTKTEDVAHDKTEEETVNVKGQNLPNVWFRKVCW